MAKLLVVEDNVVDAQMKYGHLLDQHDVEVVYHCNDWDWEEKGEQVTEEMRDRMGDIPLHRDARELTGFDLYFLDGLNGQWEGYFDGYLGSFPVEKTFIASGDPLIRQDAREKGFEVVHPNNIADVVNEYTS